jgi:hypothetical protein
MATTAGEPSGLGGFLKAGLAQAADRRWRLHALLFLLFLGGSNAALALARPEAGSAPGLVFLLAAIVRVVALVWIGVAALRVAALSPRQPWRPDGGFWLYFLLSLLGLAAAAAGAAVAARLEGLPRILVAELIAVLLAAPLTVWTAAAAVERPLALSPGPHFRRLGAWLPPLLVWGVVLVVPLAGAHAFLSLRMIETVGTSAFWPTAIGDAALSTALVLLMLGLRLTAYRLAERG